MNWMILPLRRYAEFSGRSRRKEFWMFFLFYIILSIVAGLIDVALGFGHTRTLSTGTGYYSSFHSSGPVGAILSLACLVPWLAVSVRRLHDTNRSGWWIGLYFLLAVLTLVGVIAGIGGALVHPGALPSFGGAMLLAAVFGVATFVLAVVLLVFYCLDGTRGPNRFGPDPKDAGAAELAERFS